MKPCCLDRRLKCTVFLSNYKQHESHLFKDICVLFDQGDAFNFVSLTPYVVKMPKQAPALHVAEQHTGSLSASCKQKNSEK